MHLSWPERQEPRLLAADNWIVSSSDYDCDDNFGDNCDDNCDDNWIVSSSDYDCDDNFGDDD